MSTSIEWTDETWNPIAGCSKVSEGCRNCYAMRMAHRLAHMGQAKYRGLTQKTAAGVNWTGELYFDRTALLKPLTWKKPRRIFVNSMSDLFHENCPEHWIERVFAVMAMSQQHTYQILTKRPERMAEIMSTPYCKRSVWRTMADKIVERPGGGRGWCADQDLAKQVENPPDNWTWPLPNVWLGTSVENQATANERIPHLLKTPAAVRFLSCEPLLGAVDLNDFSRTPGAAKDEITEEDDALGAPLGGVNGIDWVIVGGESGQGARPMHPDWVRSLRDQCQSAAVPFFFKQWGNYADPQHFACDGFQAAPRNEFTATVDGHTMWRVGKKAAGRSLDGRTWDEFPKSSEQRTVNSEQ